MNIKSTFVFRNILEIFKFLARKLWPITCRKCFMVIVLPCWKMLNSNYYRSGKTCFSPWNEARRGSLLDDKSFMHPPDRQAK